MFWFWLWVALTGCIVITSHISMARGDKRLSRALLEAMVANLMRTVGVALLVSKRWQPCACAMCRPKRRLANFDEP